MSAELDPRDPLTDRLRAFGRHPVDPALQSEHLTSIAGVRSGRAFRSVLAGRVKVGAGVLAGFLLGASGLTAAGAMGPLQPIAADVVETVVPVDVPRGKADEAKARAKAAKEARKANGSPSLAEDGRSIGTLRYWGPECGPGDAGNRGQYLKQQRALGAAAFASAKATDCGKPLASLNGEDGEDGDEGDRDEAGTAESTEAPKAEGADQGPSDEHGKATAPGQQEGAERGRSGDEKPEDEGRSDDAPAGPAEQPESVPVPEDLPEPADEAAPEHAPGSPTDPKGRPDRTDV